MSDNFTIETHHLEKLKLTYSDYRLSNLIKIYLPIEYRHYFSEIFKLCKQKYKKKNSELTKVKGIIYRKTGNVNFENISEKRKVLKFLMNNFDFCKEIKKKEKKKVTKKHNFFSNKRKISKKDLQYFYEENYKS